MRQWRMSVPTDTTMENGAPYKGQSSLVSICRGEHIPVGCCRESVFAPLRSVVGVCHRQTRPEPVGETRDVLSFRLGCSSPVGNGCTDRTGR